jgi:hypothetical protein
VVLAAAGTMAGTLFLRFAGQREFDTWSTVALCYVAPAAMAALCFLSLRFNPVARLCTLLVLVSLTVSLYIVEIGLISALLSRYLDRIFS